MAKKIKVACLGWGSLTYAPGSLRMEGKWKEDGPRLPVEFARQSIGNKITLVLCPNVRCVTSLWTWLDVYDLPSAEENLGLREYPKASHAWVEENIGVWSADEQISRGRETDAVGRWAKAREIDGVVWTNLPCKFGGVANVMPTAQQVLQHLRSLVGSERAAAEAYVRKTPLQIDTEYRQMLAKELGWTYLAP
jgi:hypothetical protein